MTNIENRIKYIVEYYDGGIKKKELPVKDLENAIDYARALSVKLGNLLLTQVMFSDSGKISAMIPQKRFENGETI